VWRLSDPRPGCFEQHLSTAFQQLTGSTPEMLPQKHEGALGVTVDQNPAEINQLIILED
jgi:hypothetical protein